MRDLFYTAPEVNVEELFSDGCICESEDDQSTMEDIVDGEEISW